MQDWVIGNGERLKQVVLNLVSNAIKFTSRGSVELRLSAEQVDPGRSRITIAVHDTAIGIAPEAVSRLFQPFTQVDGSRSRSQGGTGFGLAIRQRIIEAMGGRITVQTVPGKGSVFSFTLDLECDDVAAEHVAPNDSALGDWKPARRFPAGCSWSRTTR